MCRTYLKLKFSVPHKNNKILMGRSLASDNEEIFATILSCLTVSLSSSSDRSNNPVVTLIPCDFVESTDYVLKVFEIFLLKLW